MDNLARLDTALLYPPFLERITEALAELNAQGHRFIATSGYRSFAEQAALYARGRTAPGKIVTHARPGYSGHNWGISVDLAFDLDPTTTKLEPSWKEAHLKLLADAATQVGGLDPGLYWSKFKDGPHVGLDLSIVDVGWKHLLKVAPTGDPALAWAYLDGRFGRVSGA